MARWSKDQSLAERTEALRSLYQKLLVGIKHNLTKDKFLTPVVFAICDDSVKVIGLEFTTLDEKRAAYAKVDKMLREFDAWGAVLVNETWIASFEAGEILREMIENVVPSEHPNRREAVSVLLTTRGLTEHYVIPFGRLGGEIVFEEEDGPQSVEQRLIRFFEEGVH